MTHPPDSPHGPPPGHAMDRPALLSALHARIARLDRSGTRPEGGNMGDSVPLCAAIDQHLPGGGLARAAVHEVLAADPGAAAGFCALALARASGAGNGAANGAVMWIAP